MMNKQVRRNVFETNSSSSHSITLDGRMSIDTSLVPVDGEFTLDVAGEFGWGPETYNDAHSKACYAVIDGRLDLVIVALAEQLQCKVRVNVPNEDGYDFNAYIDHQSVGTTGVITTVEQMKNFIFNRNCELEIDNDNH